MAKYFIVSKKIAKIQLYAITGFILAGLACLLIMFAFGIFQEYHNQNHGTVIIFTIILLILIGALTGIFFSFKEKRKKLLDMPDNEDILLKMAD